MTNPAQPLYYREFGNREMPKLCLLHGLFGSSNNWLGIIKHLQDEFHILAPDLRNHGRSPHHDLMDFTLMGEDLLGLFDQLGLDSVHLLGHSMGGKTAMWLALQYPERINKLVVADTAPVTYDNRFRSIFQGLNALSLEQIQSREAADQILSKWVKERVVRQYLMQNLLKQPSGWSWRFNLSGLEAAMPALLGFPMVEGKAFAGDVLFIHGERSDYVTRAYQKKMGQLFPHYRQRLLHNAGHWLYAEQPAPFAQAVLAFLKS
ncbi:MAG: alpha/beta fold hydrolase [Candidatus Thiodiazotropha sp. (ex Lucinoma borealis)]|nr:alpha/beta fold hydrolase [Candidatus Thiodiazotropha sp. (ex Lucinoma borealis)]